MAGTIKLDGATFLEKDGGNYKISNTELKLKSSGNTIVDSSGNAVLSESGGNVSVGNLRLPATGGIKDSSGNNVLTESGGNVTATNVAIDGAGYKPAEVWLSTTTINSATTNIDLPAGYSTYSLRGTDLFFSESGSAQGRISLYFEYGSYTTDTALVSFTRFARIESANANDNRHTGFLVLAENMAGESGDNLNFIGWIHDPTTSGRTRAYSCDFLTTYGHDGAGHSYSYRVAGRSETTNVITRIQIIMSANSGSVVAPYGGKVVLTGMTE